MSASKLTSTLRGCGIDEGFSDLRCSSGAAEDVDKTSLQLNLRYHLRLLLSISHEFLPSPRSWREPRVFTTGNLLETGPMMSCV